MGVQQHRGRSCISERQALSLQPVSLHPEIDYDNTMVDCECAIRSNVLQSMRFMFVVVSADVASADMS